MALLRSLLRSRASTVRVRARDITRVVSSDASSATFEFGDAQARYYDDVLVDGIFKPWTESMFETSRPVAGDRVLDVATGTGVVAREIARAVGSTGKVTALDNSPGMLNRARSKPADADAATISYVEEDACASTTLPSREFHRAYCQQGLQFMPDPAAAMRAVLASLQPGGHFTAAVWSPASAESNQTIYHLCEALRNVGKDDWVDVADKPMSWSTTDAAGVSKLEDCLVDAGFINPDAHVEDGEFRFKDMATAVDIAKVGPFGEALAADEALWNAFRENYAARLARFERPDGAVIVPARSFIAHGVAPWN